MLVSSLGEGGAMRWGRWLCYDVCVGPQWSDETAVVRRPDPGCRRIGWYCHHIDEGGDLGRYGMGRIRGDGDMASE